MNIFDYLKKVTGVEIKEQQYKRKLNDIMWVEKTRQYIKDIINGHVEPIRVFEGNNEEYRIIDGYTRTEALIIVKMVSEGKAKGDFSDLLCQGVEYNDILNSPIYIEEFQISQFNAIIKLMCLGNLRTDEVFRSDYNRENGIQLIKRIAKEEYNKEEWKVPNEYILDTFVTYTTGKKVYSHRIMQLKKSELLIGLKDFDKNEFFEFLLYIDDLTGKAMAQINEFYMRRIGVCIANAYYIAKKEGKLVKNVEKLGSELLSWDKTEIICVLGNIKTSISMKLYEVMTSVAYSYLTGITPILDWNGPMKKYYL